LKRIGKLSAAVAVLVVLVFVAALSYGMVARKNYIWLGSYLRQRPASVQPTDIIVLMGDHFEPGNETQRVQEWVRRYPQLFGSIKDTDGRPPQHSFFYPAEQFNREQARLITELVKQGYGEMELHLHHHDDTSATLRAKIEKAKKDFGEFGALIGTDGKPHFAFIHGNWSLDNSAGAKFCGVNDEISILREEGAYVDYTFPAYGNVSQPSMVNSIYYAVDDPDKPKSYDTGERMRVGGQPPAKGFLIFEGALVVHWIGSASRRFMPLVDYSSIEGDPVTQPLATRFADWVADDVSVQGRPEWVFVKMHTHGASDSDMPVVLSERMADFYRSMVSYANQHHARLHFVTAREAYNIAKAAEAGKTGDAGQYRDFLIPPYAVRQGAPAAGAH
jgi:hypothetical protein